MNIFARQIDEYEETFAKNTKYSGYDYVNVKKAVMDNEESCLKELFAQKLLKAERCQVKEYTVSMFKQKQPKSNRNETISSDRRNKSVIINDETQISEYSINDSETLTVSDDSDNDKKSEYRRGHSTPTRDKSNKQSKGDRYQKRNYPRNNKYESRKPFRKSSFDRRYHSRDYSNDRRDSNDRRNSNDRRDSNERNQSREYSRKRFRDESPEKNYQRSRHRTNSRDSREYNNSKKYSSNKNTEHASSNRNNYRDNDANYQNGNFRRRPRSRSRQKY